jgi:hypothetical protein
MAERQMSDNAGCAWLFGILMAGVVAVVLIGTLADTAKYHLCVENGGQWDGSWKSCTK